MRKQIFLMSSPSHSSFPPAPSQSEDEFWEQVAEAIDELAAGWESHLSGNADEPDIAVLVPGDGSELRRLALPELVKVDMEYRWQSRREPRKIEEYLAEFPELGTTSKLPVELIHEELQIRMQAGEAVSEEEIRQRFPQQAEALCELVGGMAVKGTPTCTYFAETLQGTSQKTDVTVLDEIKLDYKPGDRLDDFELLTMLGKGAFAQVFLARQVSMERLVALKISAHKGSEPQTLAQLDHGNIVRVFDQRQSKQSGVRLLYMEVVPGGTLQEVVNTVRRLPRALLSGQVLLDAVDQKLGASGVPRPEHSPTRHWLKEASWPMTVCFMGAHLAEGLTYAHSKGVMHRDIKPANVLLTPEGLPKLADFNVSYNGGRADESPEDTFGGSLVYMSPEQLQACHPVLGGSPQLVRGASDVYSLGVLLWELLCGERPFEDDSREGGELARIQRMVDRRHYVNFNELEAKLPKDCPDSLRRVLIQCLQPRKNERYESADEVARQLRLCMQPKVWQMLQPPINPLTALMLKLPVLTVVLAGLLPNALAGGFNYTYNLNRIEANFPQLLERFDTVQMWINGVAFSLGVLVGIGGARRAMKLLNEENPEVVAEGGRRVLFFGLFISLLTFVMWTVSGLIFPVALNVGNEIPNPVQFYGHFFTSLVICGSAAMAYPYFLLTALGVRCYFPALVRNNIIRGPRWNHLQRVRLFNELHLAISAIVPMLGMGLVGMVQERQDWALEVASIVGVAGFVAMFGLERLIDSDLDALEKIAVDTPRRY